MASARVPGNFSSHSFRIGAATVAARNGVPDHLIQTMGRWSSNAYQLYIRTPSESLTTLSQKLVWHYLYINKQNKTSKTKKKKRWLCLFHDAHLVYCLRSLQRRTTSMGLSWTAHSVVSHLLAGRLALVRLWCLGFSLWMYGDTRLPLFAGPSVLQAPGDGCVLGGSRFQGCLVTSFAVFSHSWPPR